MNNEFADFSAKELLRLVNEAIATILKTGQSYKIGSRSLTRANITELKNLKNDLESQVSAENGTADLFTDTSVAFFSGR